MKRSTKKKRKVRKSEVTGRQKAQKAKNGNGSESSEEKVVPPRWAAGWRHHTLEEVLTMQVGSSAVAQCGSVRQY